MKKLALLLFLVPAISVPILSTPSVFAQADYSKEKTRNPNNDKDVDQGWKEHQDWYKEHKQEIERKSKKEVEKPFQVDTSGDTKENQKK